MDIIYAYNVIKNQLKKINKYNVLYAKNRTGLYQWI